MLELSWCRALASASVLVLGAGLLYGLARWCGFRSFAFAFQLHFTLMGVASALDRILDPGLDGPRFDVARGEVELYRRLGVRAFMVGLRRVGWTALTRDPRVFDGTRATLAAYERATRHGENAHAWIFVVVLVPCGWAIARGWWDAAAWMGSMNVLFQGYPILLQRTQRARLRKLIARSAAHARAERDPRSR